MDSNIVEGLSTSLVAFTELDYSPAALLQQIKDNGFVEARMLGINPRKFLISSNIHNDDLNSKRDFLSKWFYKIRPFNEKDFILQRLATLECIGLPMQAWVEENVKAYSSHLGEWLSWKYQNRKGCYIFNPQVTISTSCFERIEDSFDILV